MRHRVLWYAAGGGLSRCGPFASQVDAWAAMRLTAEESERQRSEHPRDTRVWPERRPVADKQPKEKK